MADVDALQEALDGVRDDVKEIKSAMSRMAEAVVRLAVLEERHTTVSNALERAFGAISKLEARVRDLEQAQPVQRLTSGWMTSSVAFGAGVVAMFLLKKVGVM